MWVVCRFSPMSASGVQLDASGAIRMNTACYNVRYLCGVKIPKINEALLPTFDGGLF